jgi:amidase
MALDIAAAEQKRPEVYHRLRILLEHFDVLLTPAAPVKPFPLEMDYPDRINGQELKNYIDWIAPTFLITLVGLPAASAPAGLTRDGLPVGIQIVASRFEEPRILRLASLIQRRSGVGWPP